MRTAICERLAWFGVALDPLRNAAGAAQISRDGAGVDIRVIVANEEVVIAAHTLQALSHGV